MNVVSHNVIYITVLKDIKIWIGMTHLIIQQNIVVGNKCAQIILAVIGMIIIQLMIILQIFLKVIIITFVYFIIIFYTINIKDECCMP